LLDKNVNTRATLTDALLMEPLCNVAADLASRNGIAWPPKLDCDRGDMTSTLSSQRGSMVQRLRNRVAGVSSQKRHASDLKTADAGTSDDTVTIAQVAEEYADDFDDYEEAAEDGAYDDERFEEPSDSDASYEPDFEDLSDGEDENIDGHIEQPASPKDAQKQLLQGLSGEALAVAKQLGVAAFLEDMAVALKS